MDLLERLLWLTWLLNEMDYWKSASCFCFFFLPCNSGLVVMMRNFIFLTQIFEQMRRQPVCAATDVRATRSRRATHVAVGVVSGAGMVRASEWFVRSQLRLFAGIWKGSWVETRNQIQTKIQWVQNCDMSLWSLLCSWLASGSRDEPVNELKEIHK